MSRKVGALSNEDQQTIVQLRHTHTMEEIAEQLDRTPAVVKKYLLQKGLYMEKTQEELDEEARLKLLLYNLAYWPTIVASYDDEEIQLYENNWLSIIKQLNEDVSYTEHLYIQDWIILILERHRILSKKKESRDEIRALKAEIQKMKAAESDNPMDMAALESAKVTMAMLEGAEDHHISSLEKIQKEIKNISSKVRADRETRRNVENSADTFWGYVAKLEDDAEFHSQESFRAEILRASMEKARNDAYENHEYIDKTVDRCILNHESIELDEEE